MSVPPFTPADAIALGLSIIPVGLNKKPYWDLLPKGPDGKPIWKPFQTRLPTQDEFAAWMRANPPAFAIATGAFSRLVTFDFDGDKGVVTTGLAPHPNLSLSKKIATSETNSPSRRTIDG